MNCVRLVVIHVGGIRLPSPEASSPCPCGIARQSSQGCEQAASLPRSKKPDRLLVAPSTSNATHVTAVQKQEAQTAAVLVLILSAQVRAAAQAAARRAASPVRIPSGHNMGR